LHAYSLALAPQQEQDLLRAHSGSIPALHRAIVPLHSSPGFPVSVVSGRVPGFRVDAVASEPAFSALLAVVEAVQARGCAHNVLFFSDKRGGVCAIVYCRAKAEGTKDAGCVNVAISELAGHIFAKSREAFESYSAHDLDAMVEAIALPPAIYRGLCDDVVQRVVQLLHSDETRRSPPAEPKSGTFSAISSDAQREQLAQTLAQLQALRSQLQQEIGVLKTQIGGLHDASEVSRAELNRAAALHAEQLRSGKEGQVPAAEVAALPSSGINYVLFAVIAVYAAIACSKYFGPLLF